MSEQLDLFAEIDPPRAEHINPFAKVQGVNLFGNRGLFVTCWDCTGGDLMRPGYAG